MFGGRGDDLVEIRKRAAAGIHNKSAFRSYCECREGVFFASTKVALEVLERYLPVTLRKRELREGMLLALKDGAIVRKERFRPDLEYVEDNPLPTVRAPLERDVCLSRLAVLAA